MADNAARDQNFVPTLLGVSSANGTSPVKVYADPTTHRLLVDSGASATTAATWGGSGGNTTTVTDATVKTTSIIVVMPATPPAGNWGIVCSNGSFVITSSDAESAALAFSYKVFP